MVNIIQENMTFYDNIVDMNRLLSLMMLLLILMQLILLPTTSLFNRKAEIAGETGSNGTENVEKFKP